MTLKSTNWVAIANIKSFNGVAKASVKSKNWLLLSGGSAVAKVLVVAWGGGGGKVAGAGAWAWGMLYDALLPITLWANTVIVGIGGIGSTSSSLPWTNGSNSVFGTLTAIWGGGGGSNDNTAPAASGVNGGSGWGNAGTGSSTQYTKGLWTSWQGNNWGIHKLWAPAYWSGWWGWASAVWQDGTASKGGDGGAWLANSISGTSVTYAWGGGASTYNGAWSKGSGGVWGGWDGTLSWNGVNGTANTWGGWGGWGYVTWNWGDWGSGIVIISYATDGSDGITTSSTGGTITTSWTQTIHTFTSSGTFTAI